MKHPLLLALLLSALCACKRINTNPAPDDYETTFQAILDEAIDGSYGHVTGASMTVIAPDVNISWSGTSGYDSEDKDQLLHVDQPFRIASVTKTFVAAAMLRLHETGRIDLDDPITGLMTSTHQQILRDGGYEPDSISWRQCLNHTSGLFDYAMGGRTYSELIINNPQRRWTRTEQLQLAMDGGQRTGDPGERYSYGDTGYILAGAAIEMLTDTNLGAGLNQLLHYSKLNLQSTWLESIEEAPKDHLPFVHRYFQRYDVTDWEPSMDLYGGGGLVSTTPELATFFHAVFNDQIFEQEQTLSLMLEPPVYAATYLPEEDDRYKDYRLGLWKIKLFGEDAYMHGGLWGTGILHVPALNCTVAVNYTKGRWDRLLKQVVLTVKHLKAAKIASSE